MPRHLASDAVAARIARLVSTGGFSAADFTVESTFYASPSGKKLHANSNCRQVRSPSYTLVTRSGVIGVDQLDRCSCSLEHPPGMLARRIEAGEAIVALEQQVAATSAHMSLLDVQAAQHARRVVEPHRGADWCQPRLDEAIAAADALLASDAARSCLADAPRRVIRHCLLQVLFGVAPEDQATTSSYASRRSYPDVESGSELDLLLRENSYGKHQALPETWAAFCAAVLADRTTAEAVDEAIGRAGTVMSEAPAAVSQIAHLAAGDVDLANHATVGDAIAVTWRRIALDATAGLVRSWGVRLDAALDAAVHADEMTLLAYEFDHDGDTNVRKHLRIITDVLAEFGPQIAGALTVVCVPDVIADWVAARTKTACHQSWGPQLFRRISTYRPVPAAAAASAALIATRLIEDDDARKTEQLLCSAALTAAI